MTPYRSLILGGVKSGKSGYAQKLANQHSKGTSSNVSFIATATANDAEMQARIERHKSDRNPDWELVEEPLALGQAIAMADQKGESAESPHCIVVDCLTLWVTNLLMQNDEQFMRAQLEEFKQAVTRCRARLIIVSNETNMGITPLGELSRRFCDETGMLHQSLGDICEHVALIIAGLPLSIKGCTNMSES